MRVSEGAVSLGSLLSLPPAGLRIVGGQDGAGLYDTQWNMYHYTRSTNLTTLSLSRAAPANSLQALMTLVPEVSGVPYNEQNVSRVCRAFQAYSAMTDYAALGNVSDMMLPLVIRFLSKPRGRTYPFRGKKVCDPCIGTLCCAMLCFVVWCGTVLFCAEL